jgi:hypothetical protein
MPRVKFEPATPVFEREKTVHALDRAATAIGNWKRIASGNMERSHPYDWLPVMLKRGNANCIHVEKKHYFATK